MLQKSPLVLSVLLLALTLREGATNSENKTTCDEAEEGLSLMQLAAAPLQAGHHDDLAAISGNKVARTSVSSGDGYVWPSGTGRTGHYTSSQYKAPPNAFATGPAWNWTDPRGRYRTIPNSVNIDDKNNIYLLTLDSIRKFSPDGALLWSYIPHRELGEEMPDSSSLYQGALYVSTTHGWLYSIDMETGGESWKSKIGDSCDGNNGWVSASEGTVILGSDASDAYKSTRNKGRVADQHVSGVNATTGKVIWKYKPDVPVWNFMGSFAGDGTFTFQDYEGGVYRNRVSDGTNIWKKPGFSGSWTDGSALLGPNKVVYAVSNRNMEGGTDAPGDVSAYRLKDGKLLWRVEVPRPPNNMPAIGQLHGHKGLSLVQPIGQQDHSHNQMDIYALDAETGAKQWIFYGPSQKDHLLVAGDRNLLAQAERVISRVRPITLPNPWSAPSIDGNGIVFIGNQEGGFYALSDADENGVIEGDSELSMFDTGACFSGSSAAAIAENMIVATSIDAMYVFRA